MRTATPPDIPTKQRHIDALRKMARSSSHASSVLETRDVFASDDDMEAFIRDSQDHWRVGCLMRQCITRKHTYMTKAAFAKWKASLHAPDDDRPLKEVL